MLAERLHLDKTGASGRERVHAGVHLVGIALLHGGFVLFIYALVVLAIAGQTDFYAAVEHDPVTLEHMCVVAHAAHLHLRAEVNDRFQVCAAKGNPSARVEGAGLSPHTVCQHARAVIGILAVGLLQESDGAACGLAEMEVLLQQARGTRVGAEGAGLQFGGAGDVERSVVARALLGWFAACVVFVAVSLVLMVPMALHVQERSHSSADVSGNASLRDIFRYLKGNRYLTVTLAAMLLLGLASLEQKMAIYTGRIWLGQENMATLVAGGAALSVITVSAVVPRLAKKWDKFYVLCAGLLFAIVMDVIAYFAGYDNLAVALLMTMLKCSGLGFWSVVIYMLVADTVEYGTYRTGVRATGITFSLQTFVAKLKNGLMGSLVLLSLSSIGFVAGEGAVQPAGVADGVWALFCLFPAAGFAIALILLLLGYKLRTRDVQVMARYNNGEISRQEAEACLGEKYGPAGDV